MQIRKLSQIGPLTRHLDIHEKFLGLEIIAVENFTIPSIPLEKKHTISGKHELVLLDLPHPPQPFIILPLHLLQDVQTLLISGPLELKRLSLMI